MFPVSSLATTFYHPQSWRSPTKSLNSTVSIFTPSSYTQFSSVRISADLTPAFFFLAMAIMCFVYLICSLRTNVVFFMIFLTLTIAFSCLAGAFWQLSNGNTLLAGRLQVTAGALTFATCMFGWWIFIAILLAGVDFPYSLPGTLLYYLKVGLEY
jgi:succinate-acetate transporter protein